MTLPSRTLSCFQKKTDLHCTSCSSAMNSPCYQNLSPRYFSFSSHSRLKSHILSFHVTETIINFPVSTGMIQGPKSSIPYSLLWLCIWFVLANCYSSSCSPVIALLSSSFKSSNCDLVLTPSRCLCCFTILASSDHHLLPNPQAARSLQLINPIRGHVHFLPNLRWWSKCSACVST